jgi:hypothetical protein
VKQDRLRNIATQVLAQAAENPPEWYPEWLEWLHGMLGPPPDQSVGNSAHDEYKVFAMGSLLSWGYFDAMSKEQDDETMGPSGLGDGSTDNGAGASRGSADDAGVRSLLIPPQTFTILDAAGEPLVTGRK